MKLTSKYLIVPINLQMQNKTIRLTAPDGRLVYDFTAFLDLLHPTHTMYLDIARFQGLDVTLSVDGGSEILLAQTDEREPLDVSASYLRPQIHFTASRGWLNDPNGLVYHNGTYHMFFQHNPVAPVWGNMHWGHAVSRDLFHWEEQDCALFPDEKGTMFSGSAVVDKRNVSGLSPNGDAILLFYTAAGGSSQLSEGQYFTQCMAYSVDGGKTFTKYEKNPVVPHVAGANRDPKVVWCEELSCYLMALYLDGREYGLFVSDNLLNWTLQQKVTMPEDDECPDFYPLTVENEPQTRKWVFSGAHDTYAVGHMDPATRQFVMDGEARPYHVGGRVSYAAQTFSDVPAGRRIKIPWEVMEAQGTLFGCQMGLPCDIALVRTGDSYLLRSLPVEELERLVIGDTATCAGDGYLTLSQKDACEIRLSCPRDAADGTLSFFGVTFTLSPKENKAHYVNTDMPLSLTEGDGDLRIYADTLGLEVFADGGLIYSTDRFVLDKNLNTLRLAGKDYTVSVRTFRSVYDTCDKSC